MTARRCSSDELENRQRKLQDELPRRTRTSQEAQEEQDKAKAGATGDWAAASSRKPRRPLQGGRLFVAAPAVVNA